ncbi:hypothetical protein DICPUDRAFT_156909 [Dictyostelium purpureum]|uniref:Uncharacterized protein n=1 Tax=Dictyostelium purpureum TaxID=5786 RepID=F0ZXR8_DICPU|nr:uncharacterized protein DICPUDRAFT_156909 [Dictyostelium purpureum]EGC31261.1 hypothetical protein DICPUDRAFT_156909 [Dictyostelium purpureum]|eukprot:XP_003292206.1 hypothetical protein DICPUDRAFT_156909 [Dictyostelium purpureum]
MDGTLKHLLYWHHDTNNGKLFHRFFHEDYLNPKTGESINSTFGPTLADLSAYCEYIQF